MFRQLGIGAAFALTAAAIAVGCGSKGSTTITGSSGELGGSNGLPASSINTNNVDKSDNGGFSGNNLTAQGFNTFVCKFNQKRPNCDGRSTVSQGDAMIFFVVNDVANNRER